jgi:hypothetical protein
MAALALYTDCQTRWGRLLTADEIMQVDALLTDASALVLDVADLTTDWTAATLPAAVLPVVCEVVRRAFDNPAGLQGETIGDYTWRGTKTDETSSVYLTASEKRTIRRATGRLAVGTVTLSVDTPFGPIDSRLYSPLEVTDGVTVVNQAEPEDL